MSSCSDHADNFLRLAFGVLIGALWIISNLNANMMPMRRITEMVQPTFRLQPD